MVGGTTVVAQKKQQKRYHSKSIKGNYIKSRENQILLRRSNQIVLVRMCANYQSER